MSRISNCVIHKTISKWTKNSFRNYPSKQCYFIINRYINSNSLFNEINASFSKLKQNTTTTTTQSTSNNSKPKQPKKSKPSKNKQLINKSVSLVNDNNNNKSLTLKQRNNDYLSQIKLPPNQSIFDKYELMAHNLKQENIQLDKTQQIKRSKYGKENIDKYKRKEFVEKQKQKRSQFEDAILSELEFYDMNLPDLISTDNITKTKPIQQQQQQQQETSLIKYDESELTTTNQNNLENEIIITPYDEMFNGLIESTNQNKKINKKELIKSIDWTKLENYVELNGWNNFAEFLNETENEKEIIKYSIPSFLSEVPKRRNTLNRPKARILGNEETAFKFYKINEQVAIEGVKYLRNGNIAVLVNNKHYGFIKKHNLAIDIRIGEYHIGYVYDINYFGKIEIILEKPNFWSRMNECQRRIINVLRYCNGNVEISDKCEPVIIKKMFQMSKKNFKRALGMLLKNKIVEIFNENDVDIPSKIILNQRAIDLKRYDVGKEVEERMWKSKPIWEYGVSAPPYQDILPDEIKERRKKEIKTYQRKFTVRKKVEM
eukprot:551196_1